MYDNGTKQTMRGWMWNRICEFIYKPHRRASTVFYLAAADDFDREAAISKGFAAKNLFAIDRDESAIAAVRARGGLGIPGELSEILIHRPLGHPPDVIVADLTCGIYESTLDLARIMYSQSGCVCAINMKRGRDELGGELSREFVEAGGTSLLLPFVRVTGDVGDASKHRGLLMFFKLVDDVVSAALAMGMPDEMAMGFLTKMTSVGRPVIASYRSKDDIAIFDLVVFRVTDDEPEDVVFADAAHEIRQLKMAEAKPRRIAKLRRKLAAFKAVRTKGNRIK